MALNPGSRTSEDGERSWGHPPVGRAPQVQIPEPDDRSVRGSGPLGLFPNVQDVTHVTRETDIYQLAKEGSYGLRAVTAAELRNVQTVQAAAIGAQHILDSAPPIPVVVQATQQAGGTSLARIMQLHNVVGEEMSAGIANAMRWRRSG